MINTTEDERRERVRALLDEGKMFTEIAEVFDCSKTTISKWCKEWGYSAPKRFNHKDAVLAAYAEGMTCNEVARKVGCKPQTVREWAAKLDLKLTSERAPVPKPKPKGPYSVQDLAAMESRAALNHGKPGKSRPKMNRAFLPMQQEATS